MYRFDTVLSHTVRARARARPGSDDDSTAGRMTSSELELAPLMHWMILRNPYYSVVDSTATRSPRPSEALPNHRSLAERRKCGDDERRFCILEMSV